MSTERTLNGFPLLDAAIAEAGLRLPSPFDPRRDEHLELAAGALLRRFREHDDVEAFALLVELCQERLRQVARGVARRLAVVLDPDDLVAGFLARLFADPRRHQGVVRRFLALARTAMRYDALNQLRLQRRARRRGARWAEGLAALQAPPDPALVIEEGECRQALPRLATLLLVLVHRCFHELGPRERRVLRLREVDGLSYDELAEALGIPRNQVGMVLKRARERLARRIEGALRVAARGARPGDHDGVQAEALLPAPRRPTASSARSPRATPPPPSAPVERLP